MALELKQTLSQKMVMTPQLKQAIKLLQLSKLELQDYITEQMNENPVLEQDLTDQEKGLEDNSKSGEDMIADQMAETGMDQSTSEDISEKIDWEQFAANTTPVQAQKSAAASGELPSLENTLTRKETLNDHLMFQLSMSKLTDEERELGSLIISDIDDNGYFRFDPEEYVKSNKLDPLLFEDLLDVIQRFDPIGVGARNLQECLQIQIKYYRLNNGVVEKIVSSYMDQLEVHKFKEIAKGLKVPLNKVIESVKIISHLEPRPGRPFGGDDTIYITPDIYVFKDGDNWVITLNEDGLPKLKISPFYKNVLNEKTQTKDEKVYIQEKLKSAAWLIKSIHQRQRTIYKVMESILKFQTEFFERGISSLKPMVLKDVAEDIEMHESTVSRVTTNKYVHTPRGIFELKYFFNSSVSKLEGSEMASESVKEYIRKIISDENPKKPLSDQSIVDKLKVYEIAIARRTVAKYREQLGILTSSKRKKHF